MKEPNKPESNQPESSQPENQSPKEDFVFFFNRLLQTVRIHDADNQLSVKAAEQFIAAGRRLLEKHPEITVEAMHERLFVQGEKLLLKQQSAAVIFSLLGLFENLSLYGLKFTEFSGVRQQQVFEMARLLVAAQSSDDPLARIKADLGEARFNWLQILSEPQGQGEMTASRKSAYAHQAYSYAYNSVKEVVQQIQSNDRAGVRKSVRVIQDITDMVFIDKRILLGISTIRDYDDYTFTHSVNVAIQAICLGHEIGLSRNHLVRLGICGLFHDLGKIVIPIEIINKPGHLNVEEYQTIKEHPLNSVRQILKLDAYRDLIAQIILPPFEHHLNYDLSGYPEVNWSRPLSLFGRIIEICDVFDALTGPRIYRNAALSQDRALGLMLSKSGREFDPLLLKWFINMIGTYPVGTLVKLNTGEAGLIYGSGNGSEETARPQVLLLKKTGKKQLKAAGVVDLNARDKKSGRYQRRIKSTHNPYQYGIQPALFLMQAE